MATIGKTAKTLLDTIAATTKVEVTIMETENDLVTVEDLLEKKYFIPSYQRGYRWEKQQVEDLIDDIRTFEGKDWYCLQPIIVKEKRYEEKETKYEVIDGQQRLTTLFLINQCVNYAMEELYSSNPFNDSDKKKDSPEPNGNIEYETRKHLNEFIKMLDTKDIEELNKNIEELKNKNSIDSFHLINAYEVILRMVETIAKKGMSNLEEFETRFKTNTKVIWHKTIEEDPRTIFARVNVGKIPLTNAELIKAFFLSDAIFGIDPTGLGKEEREYLEGQQRLKQLEIATEWDRIEAALQDDSFWYFLGEEKKEENRIELIFNILHSEDADPQDKYAVFRKYNEEFNQQKGEKNPEEYVNEKWEKVTQCFYTLWEWYLDSELYHLVGYLIHNKPDPKKLLHELYKQWGGDTKDKFRKYIKEEIKGWEEGIDDLTYDENKVEVKSLLLLHNVLTTLESKGERFPFDLYKKQDWDIEHINPQRSQLKDEGKNKIEEWIGENLDYFPNDDLKTKAEEIKEALKNNTENEDKKNKDFEEFLEELFTEIGGNDDNLSNLALLPSEINSSLKNNLFAKKREQLINEDDNKYFIPLCTKKIFMKYYSPNHEQLNLNYWAKEDGDKYLEDIKTRCKDYLGEKKNEQ